MGQLTLSLYEKYLEKLQFPHNQHTFNLMKYGILLMEEFMDFIIFIIFGIIIFTLLGTFLPILAPILIFVLLVNVLRGFLNRRSYRNDNYDNYYESEDDTNSKYTSNPPKHDAIDVEYTEHDAGDEQ